MKNNNSLNSICSIMLIYIITMFFTPLYQSAGWVTMGMLLVVFLLCKKTLKRKNVFFYLLFFLAFVVWVISSEDILIERGRFNSLLVTIAMVCVYSLVIQNYYDRNESKKMAFLAQGNSRLIDFLCAVLLAICFFYIIKYIIHYLPTWSDRINAEPDFMADYNHVDFSVVVMITFFLGLKRNYILPSYILLIITAIALPARTMKAFILCYCFCSFMGGTIMKIYDKSMTLNKIYKWMIAMMVLIISVCYCWVNILPKYLRIQEVHEGLYDYSNYLRSKTILYSVQLILEKRLIFSGIYTSRPDYEYLIPNSLYSTSLGPHNSFLIILLNFSLVFGGLYLMWMSGMLDKFFDKKSMPFIISYLMCGLILHDMFMGIRMIYFLTALILPYKNLNGIATLGIKKIRAPF